MDKPINQKAWFLVLPVLLLVAFSAVIPLMTVVNYSVQDTFGNNEFFWAGTAWFEEMLRSPRFHQALARNLIFSAIILAIQIPLGIVVALSMPRKGIGVSICPMNKKGGDERSLDRDKEERPDNFPFIPEPHRNFPKLNDATGREH